MSKHQSSKSYLLPGETTHLLPTYPTWRVNFSVKVNLVSKLKGRFEQKEDLESINPGKKKKNVYEQISAERKQIENAEVELQKIRDERKKMDEILNRLRKALEIKDTKELEFIYKNDKIYIRKSDKGMILIWMGAFAPISMVRIHCNLIIQSLKKDYKSAKFKKFFQKGS